MFYPFALYICYAFEKPKNISKDIVGVSSANPYETSLVHLDNQEI